MNCRIGPRLTVGGLPTRTVVCRCWAAENVGEPRRRPPVRRQPRLKAWAKCRLDGLFIAGGGAKTWVKPPRPAGRLGFCDAIRGRNAESRRPEACRGGQGRGRPRRGRGTRGPAAPRCAPRSDPARHSAHVSTAKNPDGIRRFCAFPRWPHPGDKRGGSTHVFKKRKGPGRRASRTGDRSRSPKPQAYPAGVTPAASAARIRFDSPRT